MICPSCGSASSNSARFCGTCGNPLQRLCGNCGAEVGGTHRFCSACGVEVGGGTPAQEHPAERKVVTVLFADLVGSTALIEGLDPEQVAELFDPIIDAMREGVHRYGGIVSQVEGDGIMALFGAPVADEHHAIGACFAAVDIPRLVRSIESSYRVRIGVHSGEVLVRDEGNDMSVDYVASGATVHLASRLEGVARAGIPLVSAATAGLAEGNVRLGEPFDIEVDGFEGPIEVVEVLGKADAGGPLQRRMNRRLTPFVARDAEMTQLIEAYDSLEQGAGSVLTVIGGPGVGKSRLLVEFIGVMSPETFVLGSHASPYDRSTPYRPIAEMMTSWLARRGGSEYNAEEILEALDPSLTVYTDALLALIGAEPSRSWKAIDAGVRRQTTRRAVRAILGASALENPTVLVFEDQHWMDGESLTVMDELVDLAGGTPLLVLVTSRPEAPYRWDEIDHADVIELDGLMGTAVHEFVDVLVGTRSSTASIRAELSERSDGTPLFLEEMVRSLADDGVLTGEHGKYKRGESDLRVEMPAAVQTVIASRIDRLPSFAKELLQLVAVHGEDVRKDLLDATSDRPERERAEGLDILIASEMLFVDDSPRIKTYAFKHNLIREVAYASIPTKRREALHARIAEGVIALEFEEDWTERLAHHTFEAGQWEDAARFTLASAKRAAAKSAYRESESFLSMSLEALALLPKNRVNIEQTIDALLTRRISTVGVGGQIHEGLGSLDDAESLANEIGDLDRVARVNLHRSYARSMTGHHQQGLLDAERAHGIGQQLGRRNLTAEANLAKAQNYSFAGEPAPIADLLARDLTFFSDEVGRNGMMGHRIVHALAHLAIGHALGGRFDAARQAARDAVTRAAAQGLAVDELTANYALALTELTAEQFKKAEEVSRESADRALASEFSWLGNAFEIVAGYSDARLGNFDDGVTRLKRCAAKAEAMETPMQEAMAHAYLAELMTSCGQNEQARVHAQAALGSARRHGLRATEVMALQMLGRAQHLLKEARAFFEEALALSQEHDLRPLTAAVQMELGWTVTEMGDKLWGQALMSDAADLRDDMGLHTAGAA